MGGIRGALIAAKASKSLKPVDNPLFSLEKSAPDKFGNVKFRNPIHFKDGSRISGINGAGDGVPTKNVYYGYYKNGESFTVNAEWINLDDITKQTGRSGDRAVDAFKQHVSDRVVKASKERPKGRLTPAPAPDVAKPKGKLTPVVAPIVAQQMIDSGGASGDNDTTETN